MRVPGLLANGLLRFRGSTGARSYWGLGGRETFHIGRYAEGGIGSLGGLGQGGAPLALS